MTAPEGDMPDRLTVDGHLFVHVAACPCERMQREVARLAPHAPDREIGYTAWECEREMQKLGGHCADPDWHEYRYRYVQETPDPVVGVPKVGPREPLVIVADQEGNKLIWIEDPK